MTDPLTSPSRAETIPARARLERFTDDIATLRLKTGRTSVERALRLLGAVMMLGGIVVAFAGYLTSLDVTATPGTNVDVLDANSDVVLAITGVAISVVGGFIFLRYSLAAFLRLWLLRQSYEQQAVLDAALDDYSGAATPGADAPPGAS